MSITDGSPSTAFPLQECQGDCDDDDDCDWGLYCFQRGRYDGVPGCSGGESESASSDFCAPLPPERQPLPGTFRLKLWWQPGYVWQEVRTPLQPVSPHFVSSFLMLQLNTNRCVTVSYQRKLLKVSEDLRCI